MEKPGGGGGVPFAHRLQRMDQVGRKVLTTPSSDCVSNQENLFPGQVLDFIVIKCVNNDTFSHNYAKNPFNVTIQILWATW